MNMAHHRMLLEVVAITPYVGMHACSVMYTSN